MSDFERQMRRQLDRMKRWWSEQSSGSGRSRGDQRPQHKMCPVCGKFNDKSASICEYCDATLGKKRRSVSRGLGLSTVSAPDSMAELPPLVDIFADFERSLDPAGDVYFRHLVLQQR